MTTLTHEGNIIILFYRSNHFSLVHYKLLNKIKCLKLYKIMNIFYFSMSYHYDYIIMIIDYSIINNVNIYMNIINIEYMNEFMIMTKCIT